MYYKPIRLTKKTAAALIKQELGIPASKLAPAEYCSSENIKIFELHLGKYIVSVENDWHERNGLLVFGIADPGGMGSIRKYFHPETLEEDYEAGERWHQEKRHEICEDCPQKRAEPRKGYWITVHTDYGNLAYECSRCNKYNKERTHFCPSCGAYLG